MEEKVREYHQTISGGSEGSAAVSGSQEEVRSTAASATENVQQTLDEIDNQLDVTKYASIAADIVGLAGTVIATTSGITGVGALVGGVLSSGGILASASFNFLGAVAGVDGMYDIVYEHNNGLDSILNISTQ